MSQWRIEERRVHVPVVAKGELVGPGEGVVFGREGKGGRGRGRGGRKRRAMRGKEEEEGEKVRGKEEEDVEEMVLEREMVGCFGLHWRYRERERERGEGEKLRVVGFRCWLSIQKIIKNLSFEVVSIKLG